jgi:phage-related holin
MFKYLTLRNKLNFSLEALFGALVNHFWTFCCWAVGTYLMPVHSMVFVMISMVLADFVTGIWKSLKSGERISSKRMAETIEKMALYIIGIVASFVLEKLIDIEGLRIVWVFVTIIVTREYLSVLENIETITKTKILEIVSRYLQKAFTSFIKNRKNENQV